MFVMGLIAGIFGILASLFAMFLGGVASILGSEGASTISGLAWAALAFSILGIVGATMHNTRTKLGGWLMVIAGIGGWIAIFRSSH